MMWPHTLGRSLRNISSRTLSRIGQVRPDSATAVLVTALAIIFAVRYWTVAQHIDMGHDIANYLSTMNTIFGRDASGFGLNRPPLIGITLKPFAMAFGNMAGVKVLGVLVSVGLGFPFYMMAKRLCPAWIAVITTILFVLTPDYSDLLTWGYLTMFGLLFSMFALYFLLLVLDKPSKINIVLAGCSISLIVGFHQLSLLFFVFLLALVLIALAASDRQRLTASCRPILAAMAVGVLLSLPYLPVYLRLLDLQATTASSQSVSLTPLSQIRADLSFGTDLTFAQWFPLFIIMPSLLTIVALKWTWEREKWVAAMLAAVILYSLVLILLVLPPPFQELNRRAHYFLYFPLWLLAGVFLCRIWSWRAMHASDIRQRLPRAACFVVILIVAAATPFLSLTQLHRALGFYSYLDDSRRDAVNWIGDNATEPGAIVAYPEVLGWWIEAEDARNTANVTDRVTAPLTYLSERSLIAERILSRNQGIENGNLRLATTFPYAGAPGNPVLSVYAGGSYRDVIMFDESAITLATEAGGDSDLGADAGKTFNAGGNADSMTMTTSYHVDGATILQTAQLDRGSRTATVRYHFEGSPLTEVHIPLLFGYVPDSVTVSQDRRSIEVVQAIQSVAEPVTTEVSIDADGTLLKIGAASDSRLDLAFTAMVNGAEVTFTFRVTEPVLNCSTDVVYYDVREVIQHPNLEHLSPISHIAIDLQPNPNAAPQLPLGTEDWLAACPYYRLAYSAGTIRIYQVDFSGKS